MFTLRRVAVRALQYQLTRPISTLRPVSLTLRVESSKPTIYRSFHQSKQWLAEAEEMKTQEISVDQRGKEPVSVEPSAEEQQEIKEESVVAPEVADAANDSSAPAASVAQQVTEQVKNATQTATDALSSVASAVSNNAAQENGQQFPPRTGHPDAKPNKILYVGNLFFEVTQPELEAEFGRFGEIVHSRVVTDQKGMSKGFGFIEFADQNAADNAVRALNQKVFQGRRMAVNYHVRRPDTGARAAKVAHPPSKTLFIGNMSFQMSDRDLNDLFRDVRNVLDVRVAIDRRSGQPRGFAHADFIDIQSATKAKEFLEQKMIYGRQLRVDFSAESPSKPEF